MTDRHLQRLLDAAVPFALPLRRTFRGVDVREGMLIEGPAGWGEFTPFADYSPQAAARWLASAIEAAFEGWPEPLREFVEVNAIIPELSADEAEELAREAVARGCSTIKIKVGGSPDLDLARIAAVRDVLDAAFGPSVGRIRLDANAQWNRDQAIAMLERCTRYGIEYAEQPCSSLADLAVVRQETGVRIAVDEGIRTSDDPGSLELGDAADIAIIKPATLGGVRASLELASALGMPVVVSGAMDSSVGLGTALALAGALPELSLASGLGTGALLADDLVAHPVVPTAGRLSIGRIQPDATALERARARVTDPRPWRDRLTAAWNAGATDRMRDALGIG
jgi:O-succinylbenzoate synthase